MPLILTPEARSELDEAIEDGNLGKVEAFLKNGLDANALIEGTLDPLWWKSLRTPERTAKMLELFIKYGANAGHSSTDGFNALHALIDINGLGNSDEEDLIVQLLVDHGGQLEEVYQFYKWTPLMYAVMRGSLSEVHALLKAGADVNKRFPENAMPTFAPGLTLLMAAGPRLSLLKLLLQYNADPEQKNSEGENALAFFERSIAEAEREFSQQDFRARKEAHELYLQDLKDCIMVLQSHSKQ